MQDAKDGRGRGGSLAKAIPLPPIRPRTAVKTRLSIEHDTNPRTRAQARYTVSDALERDLGRMSHENLALPFCVHASKAPRAGRVASISGNNSIGSSSRGSTGTNSRNIGDYEGNNSTGSSSRGSTGTNSRNICDYEFVYRIGDGASAEVWAGLDSSGSPVAIKAIEKDTTALETRRVLQEKRIMERLSEHPFIVTLHAAYQSLHTLYFVMDFCCGGDLFAFMSKNKMKEAEVRLFAAEIALAMSHLHQHNVVYRDVKPENILISSDGHACLADFGLSTEMRPGEHNFSVVGTPQYVAPEVLLKKGHGAPVDW